jgi:GT2 family glycosyltransferase
MSKIAVVIPNWNGADSLANCLNSLVSQSVKLTIVVVDNGSSDESIEIVNKYKDIVLIKHSVNKGFAGGVNPGFRYAIENSFDYVASFNNDAVADKNWLSELEKTLSNDQSIGIATCKLFNSDGSHLDSTGDYYTNWGLPYPRGRGETDIDKYDDQTDIFAASGGASLYRVEMIKAVGLFDEDFFAYYEDVDLSFRAQLAGWKVTYSPKAIAYHQISATSSKIKGFATYQTMKNLPLLLAKNMPRKYIYRVGWRFTLSHFLFFLRAISRGQVSAAVKGDYDGTRLLFGSFKKRRVIQRSRKVSNEYIWSIIVHDLPPNAKSLRTMRSYWWKIVGKK